MRYKNLVTEVASNRIHHIELTSDDQKEVRLFEVVELVAELKSKIRDAKFRYWGYRQPRLGEKEKDAIVQKYQEEIIQLIFDRYQFGQTLAPDEVGRIFAELEFIYFSNLHTYKVSSKSLTEQQSKILTTIFKLEIITNASDTYKSKLSVDNSNMTAKIDFRPGSTWHNDIDVRFSEKSFKECVGFLFSALGVEDSEKKIAEIYENYCTESTVEHTLAQDTEALVDEYEQFNTENLVEEFLQEMAPLTDKDSSEEMVQEYEEFIKADNIVASMNTVFVNQNNNETEDDDVSSPLERATSRLEHHFGFFNRPNETQITTNSSNTKKIIENPEGIRGLISSVSDLRDLRDSLRSAATGGNNCVSSIIVPRARY